MRVCIYVNSFYDYVVPSRFRFIHPWYYFPMIYNQWLMVWITTFRYIHVRSKVKRSNSKFKNEWMAWDIWKYRCIPDINKKYLTENSLYVLRTRWDVEIILPVAVVRTYIYWSDIINKHCNCKSRPYICISNLSLSTAARILCIASTIYDKMPNLWPIPEIQWQSV